MKKLTIVSLVIVAMAATATAVPVTCTYDWSGTANYLGCEGDQLTAQVSNAANRTGSAGDGLILKKTAGTSSQYPYARGYLAAIWNLEAGDQVTVTMWRMDLGTGYPYFRLYAHYNDMLQRAQSADGQDMSVDDGNCLGTASFGSQTGWEQVSHTWTIEEGHNGLVIDAAIWGDVNDEIWIDDLQVIVPDHADVRMPDAIYGLMGDPVSVDATTWTSVKAIFE